MTKKIIFRADGNSIVGLGHLYRLFSLVEAIKDSFQFSFLTKESSTLSIIPKEYKTLFIPDSVSIEDEPIWLAKKFNSLDNIIIADGYQFNSKYQESIKKIGYKLIYIDDLVKDYMYADLVINHSPHVKKTDFKSEPYTKFALGMDFAILRPKFLEKTKEERFTSLGTDVFINFGGADSFGNTLKVTKALLDIEGAGKIHIVLGAAFRDKELFEIVKKNAAKIHIYRNLSEIELIHVMEECSFAIVPSSTILFELFCIRMPIYSGYFVENQKKAFQCFKENELVYGIGDFNSLSINKLSKELKTLLLKTDHQKMIKKQAELIDGKQLERHRNLIKAYINYE